MFPVLWPQLFFRPPQVSNQSTLAIDQTLLSATSTQDTKNTHESLSCNTTPQLQGLSFSHLNFGPAYPPTPALPALRRQATGCEGMAAASASSWNERRDEILHVNHSMGSSVKMSICNIPINWEVFYNKKYLAWPQKKTRKKREAQPWPPLRDVPCFTIGSGCQPSMLGNVMTSSNHDEFSKKIRRNLIFGAQHCFRHRYFSTTTRSRKYQDRIFGKKNCMLKLCTPESRVEAIEAV